MSATTPTTVSHSPRSITFTRTRGATVPASDFRVSWEVYQPWLRAGDPYYNPQLSLRDTRARIRLGPEDMLAVARRHVR